MPKFLQMVQQESLALKSKYHYNALKMINFRRITSLNYLFRVIKQQFSAFPNQAYYLTNTQGNKISFWNDVQLDIREDQLTCCVQIPKQRIAKMEVIKESLHHPIMQDTRNNLFTNQLELRYYAQFPYFNYGFLPQTWESTLIKDQNDLIGDNDPVDIVQLGKTQRNIGDIFRAKVLGSFCLIDQGEVDWKIILLNTEEAHKNQINQLKDIDKQGNIMNEIKRWFKDIKTFDGKKANHIAFQQKIFSKDQTLALIKKTHTHWEQLRKNSSTQFKDLRNTFKF